MSQRRKRRPSVRFGPGQEAEARAFLDSEPDARALRVAVSRRPLYAMLTLVLAAAGAYVLTELPVPAHERWSMDATFTTCIAIAVASLVFILFYAGYFVISPRGAEIRISRNPIPFSELKLPRIVVETHTERHGEFLEHESKEEGFALKCGHHLFFRGAQKSRKQIERIASALNEALREYDEREATREWLKGREAGR